MRIFASLILLICVSGNCWAKRIDIRTTKRLVIPVDNVTPKITSKDVEKLVPTDMARVSNSGNIMTRIADRGFNLWFNSSAVKNSALGRAADKTQEKLKTDVVIEEGQGSSKTKHKFSFRVEAFQALAKIEYSGWMKAAVNYDAKASQTNIQVSEKLFADKDLVVSHRATSKEALSMVGLGWQF
ncbi:hypothetical protein D3C87_109730 [compost metagenome]